MAKSINVSGRMSVERFNGEFQKAFGVRCNVKISKWVNADGKATLASIRPNDFKGPSKVDLSIVGNMTVGTLKKRFEENFGVMIELYIGRKIAPDDVTIGAIREGRAKVSKGEKPKETAPKTPKPDKPDNAQKPSGSDLTKEEIKEFKEQEKEAEDLYDYYSLAAEIVEAGDKDWARKLVQKAEDLAENSDDYNSIAESVADEDSLGDKKYAKELYQKAEDLAEEQYDYESIAASVAHENTLGDKDWARNLFQKAEDLAEDLNDYSSLAGSVADEDCLGDKKYARELYQKAEDLAEDSGDFRGLAMSVAKDAGLDDKKYAKELFKKAEDLAEDSSDYNDIAVYVAWEQYLGDKKYARELYQKAEDLAEDSGDFRGLAMSVANEDYLGDKKYARELYQKAEDLAEDFSDYQKLATSVAYNLKDNDLALKFFKIVEKLIEDHDWGVLEDNPSSEIMKHLIWLADDVLREDGFNDKDYARDLYKKAESYAKTGDDFITLSSAIEELDEEWADKLRDQGTGGVESEIKCPECGKDIHFYWGDINNDTYRAYFVDSEGQRTEETKILPRMDRVDEVKDESFYMCSGGNCMTTWDDLDEL